jgi:hypothetical protein
MAYEPIKTWLDIAPAFLSFCLVFVRNPKRAFSEVAGSATISSELTTVLLAGVALSYLILVATSSSVLKNDPGAVARWLRGLELQALPVVAVFLTFILGTLSHVTGKLFERLSRFGQQAPAGTLDPKLDGTIEDSVNAALGFAAVFLPVASGVLSVVSWLPARNIVGTAVGSLGLVLFLFVYFPWSLSATHPKTTFANAFVAFAGGVFLITLAVILWPG